MQEVQFEIVRFSEENEGAKPGQVPASRESEKAWGAAVTTPTEPPPWIAGGGLSLSRFELFSLLRRVVLRMHVGQWNGPMRVHLYLGDPRALAKCAMFAGMVTKPSTL